jgi:hypothetical protein
MLPLGVLAITVRDGKHHEVRRSHHCLAVGRCTPRQAEVGIDGCDSDGVLPPPER